MRFAKEKQNTRGTFAFLWAHADEIAQLARHGAHARLHCNQF